MTSDKNYVNLEKLSNSLKTIEQLNNNLNNMSLSNAVLEIDNDLSKISFEHGNCFNDYKEDLDSLVSGIDKLKNEMNELNIALEKTVNSFEKFENASFRKENLLASAGEVTKIPEVDTTSEETTTGGSKSINTIPIGLGIAASGIAGSVGAVIVDEKFPPDEKNPIPDYDENNEEEKPKRVVPSEQPDEFLAREEKFDDVTPYHASRDKEIIDKFYDDEDK